MSQLSSTQLFEYCQVTKKFCIEKQLFCFYFFAKKQFYLIFLWKTAVFVLLLSEKLSISISLLIWVFLCYIYLCHILLINFSKIKTFENSCFKTVDIIYIMCVLTERVNHKKSVSFKKVSHFQILKVSHEKKCLIF